MSKVKAETVEVLLSISTTDGVVDFSVSPSGWIEQPAGGRPKPLPTRAALVAALETVIALGNVSKLIGVFNYVGGSIDAVELQALKGQNNGG